MARMKPDHHHGYTWLGSGFELHNDGPRRPEHPGFRAAGVVPLESAHWLLKPAKFVQGTFHTPNEAAKWFGEQLREHVPGLRDDHTYEGASLVDRIKAASELVVHGQDIGAGFYLSGSAFFSVSVIGCSPHPVRLNIPCPLGSGPGGASR